MVIWRLLARLRDREQRILVGTEGVLLGTSRECDAVIADPTVSRRHARLASRDGTLVVEDLGSRNGTWVDGRRVVSSAVARAGSWLRVGDVELQVEAVDIDETIVAIGNDVRPQDASRAAAPASAPETMVAAGVVRFCLRELEPLLVRASVDPDPARLASLAANALVRSQPGTGARILRDSPGQPLVGSAGTVAGRMCAFAHADYILQVYGIEDRDEPGLASVARMVLAVVGMVGRGDGPAGTASSVARASSHQDAPLLTSSPALTALYSQATRVATGRLNVLITGESGTGKELLARHLHEASGEPADRFLVLNCAALPRDLLDAELFGIEAGVATGVKERAGRFELAHGGTVFLDEIGDMSLDTQARILRVLQEKEVYRVGSHRARAADVRIIAATHRDLPAMVQSGLFRLDLYHRISDWRAVLPALRERREDVPGLAALFLARACQLRAVRSGGLSKAAVDALCRYRWPGNVRELEREMARVALFLDDGAVVGSDLLRSDIRLAQAGDGPGTTLESRLADQERGIIAEVLQRCGGKVEIAARELGISKSTLYRRMEKLGLDPTADP